MITNHNIDALVNVPVVRNLMDKNNMLATKCVCDDNVSLLIYRLPFVIEICDMLIENYLEICLSDLSANLMIYGGSALGCAVAAGLQNIDELRSRRYDNVNHGNLFLSYSSEKYGNLDCELESLLLLQPIFEKQGMEPFVSNLDAGRNRFGTHAMYPRLKEKYLKCIKEASPRS